MNNFFCLKAQEETYKVEVNQNNIKEVFHINFVMLPVYLNLRIVFKM